MKLIPAQTELLTIETAGHERMARRNQQAVQPKIVEAFQSFQSGKIVEPSLPSKQGKSIEPCATS